MYTIYLGNKNYSSWSLRPWLLLQVLGIPFDEQLKPFGEGPDAEMHSSLAQRYREGLAERWRDAAHEAEVALVGEVTADLRTG